MDFSKDKVYTSADYENIIAQKRFGLYHLGISGGMAVFIPKKNYNGFLKSPFGGHHVNDNLRNWRYNYRPEFFYGDEVDIDGYLWLNMPNHWKTNQKTIDELLNSLTPVFPQAKDWLEINSDFFMILALFR